MKNRGFTLIEIITVVGIMILLAAMITVSVRAAAVHTRVQTTKDILAKLSTAITDYSVDYRNTYPPSHRAVDGNTGMAGIQALASYLFANPGLAMASPAGKPNSYLQPADCGKSMLVFKAGGTTDYVTDAWGLPLYYYLPGAPTRNTDSYDLYSAGPDMKTVTEFTVNGVDFKYADALPMEFVSGAMQLAATGTGDPGVLLGLPVNPARDQDFNDAADDITNWRMGK